MLGNRSRRFPSFFCRRQGPFGRHAALEHVVFQASRDLLFSHAAPNASDHGDQSDEKAAAHTQQTHQFSEG
jgi:hypothetical protein